MILYIINDIVKINFINKTILADLLFLGLFYWFIVTLFWIFKVPILYMQVITLFVIALSAYYIIRYFPGSWPYIVSTDKKIKKMIKLSKITNNDNVYELWCWDWRIIRLAWLEWPKKATWIEISIPLVWLWNIISKIRKNPSKLKHWSLWSFDYWDADVILLYLLPVAMRKFKKLIWPKLKKWTRVISNSFILDWVKEEKCEDKVYLYVKK